MIPGLENAEFLRYGVMHRNTYLNSPGLLQADYSMCSRPEVFFAGQMTGVEGYVESAGSGLLAGINAANRVLGKDAMICPEETMIGAMAAYVSRGGIGDFAPMNANFGLVPPLGYRVRGGKAAKNESCALAVNRAKESRWVEYDGHTFEVPAESAVWLASKAAKSVSKKSKA